jgi:SAM-dependent methyltransferase
MNRSLTRTRNADPVDPWSRIAELDDDAVAALADRLTTRAADPSQQRLWADFLARAEVGGHRVLEVGCGTGVITGLLDALPGVREVVGVDPSVGLVARARQTAPDLRFEVADGRDLPFPDHSFDTVVFATTLCHVPQPELALREAWRVLTPSGRLLVYDGDYASATVALAEGDPLQNCVTTAVRRMVHDPWLVRRLTGLVRSAGFGPGELRGHGYAEASDPAYAMTLVTVGAEALRAEGTITAETARALVAEAEARAAEGRFFCSIGYASLVAQRTEDT